MQITFSAEQVDIARKVFDVIIWPAVIMYAKSKVKYIKVWVNGLVTDNTNRNKLELETQLKTYIDDKFVDHERAAFHELDEIKGILNKLVIILAKDNLDLHTKKDIKNVS